MGMTVQQALATLLVNATAAAQWDDDPEKFALLYGLASPDLARLRAVSVPAITVTRNCINDKRIRRARQFLPVTFSVLEHRGLLRAVTNAFLAAVEPLRDPLDERRQVVDARALRDFLIEGSTLAAPEFIAQLCAFEYMCSDLLTRTAIRAAKPAGAPAARMTASTYVTLTEGVDVIRSDWDFATVLAQRREVASGDSPRSVTYHVICALGERLRLFRMPEAAWRVLSQCRSAVSRADLAGLAALPPGEIDTVVGKCIAQGFLTLLATPDDWML